MLGKRVGLCHAPPFLGVGAPRQLPFAHLRCIKLARSIRPKTAHFRFTVYPRPCRYCQFIRYYARLPDLHCLSCNLMRSYDKHKTPADETSRQRAFVSPSHSSEAKLLQHQLRHQSQCSHVARSADKRGDARIAPDAQAFGDAFAWAAQRDRIRHFVWHSGNRFVSLAA